MERPGIDVSNPNMYAESDGLDELTYLQQNCPVYWNGTASGSGFWVLTRYADAVNVYRNPKSFSSRYGIQVGQAGKHSQPAAGKMLVLSDRKDHQKIKAIVSRHLTQAALRRLLPELRTRTEQLLDRHEGGQPFDFLSQVASELTLTVLGGMLGVPESERQEVAGWTTIAFGSDSASAAQHDDLRSVEANATLFVYFSKLLKQRRRTGGNDLIGALAKPEDTADTLTDEEILFNVHLLLAGGHETTRQALAGAVVAMYEHPHQLRRLRDDMTLMPTAVEEVLRWSSPSLNVMRTATADIVIGGQQIRSGQQVTMWNPILNRDELAFPNGRQFDVSRDPNRHLSFGMGSHFCLGSFAARQEITVLLEDLCGRAGNLELAGSYRRLRSNRTWGYEELPVRLTR